MNNDDLGRMAQHFERINDDGSDDGVPAIAVAIMVLCAIAAIVHAWVF